MSDTFEQQDNDLSPNEQALSVALRLAEAGLKVFPAQNNGAPVPGFKWKDDATDDAATLRAYFLQLYKHSATAVGMPAGANDLVILDPDLKNGAKQGVEEFQKIVRERGVDLSRVPVINTPSGGQHYIFQQPTHARIGCGRGELHKHIDVKGDGGYVVAVGSIRDGKQYKQAEGSIDFLTLFRNGLMTALPAGLQQVIAKPRLATLDGNHVAEGMSIDLVREALNAIPNDEHFDDRGDWVSFAHAIFGATGGSVEGMELFLAWSETRDQKPGEPERVWESFTSVDVRAGAGTIRRELERRGLDDLLQKARKERTDRMFDDDPDDPDAPQMKPRKEKAPVITLRNFVPRDTSLIPPRQWLYGRHYVRKFASQSAAPGGYGKSSVVLVEAIAMAIGRKLLHHDVTKTLRIFYWNGEDPMDELERRIGAIRLWFQLTPEEDGLLAQNLFIESGRETQLRIATAEPREGLKVATPLVKALQREFKQHQIDVVILDPFVATHGVNESDNTLIEQIAAIWRFEIAEACDCAVELVHHTRKLNGMQADVDSARGGGSLANATRVTRVFNVMSKEEARRNAVEERQRVAYIFEADENGKANMAPRGGAPLWYKLEGQNLHNQTFDDPADNVGVATAWEPAAEAVADLTDDQHADFMHELETSEHGVSVQAGDWAGRALSRILGLNIEEAGVKDRLKHILGALVAQNVIREVRVPKMKRGRASGEDRPIYRPSEVVA